MNVERDTDRQLRAWAAEGIDRAPERFVWAALDEIEQIPQRTAWRTRLAGLAIRLRPAAVFVGAAAVILVAIAILTRVVAPNLGVGGPRPFETADLPGIVLWDDTIPATWTLDNLVSNPWEVSVVPIRSMTGAEIDAREEPDGLVAGRYTNGLGPNVAFISWSALFESTSQAEAALPFYEHEMEAEEAWGLGPGEPIAFGDGGRLYTGTTTAFLGPPSDAEPAIGAQVYLWRDGNLLLALGGYGNPDAAELRALAEGMNARADALSKTTR
jgi:hypothetical protein